MTQDELERLGRSMQELVDNSIEAQFTGAMIGGGVHTNTNTVYPSAHLTLEKVRESMRQIKALVGPPPKGIDLYAHTLDDERCFEIEDVGQCLALHSGHPRNRRMIIVPKARLLSIYQRMRAAGVDVLCEPHYGALPPPDGETRET